MNDEISFNYDTTKERIPELLKQNLIDVNYIIHVPKDHKLNVKTRPKSYAHKDSYLDGFSRWKHAENREHSIDYIEKTIDTCLENLIRYSQFKHIITDHLNRSLLGIDKQLNIYDNISSPDINSRLLLIKNNIYRATDRPELVNGK